MKALILLLAATIYLNAYAQVNGAGNDTIENAIIKDFSRLDPKKLTELVPYNQNDLWGFIDRQTKTVIIPARYNDLSFFNPNMSGYYQGRSFTIDKEGKIVVEKIEPEEDIVAEEMAADDAFRGISIISSSKGYKGFQTDSEGHLIAYADIYHYYTSGFPTWNVQPFKKGNKTYAIAINKTTGKYGVIDTLGNPLNGLDFNQKSILLNSYAKDKASTWFFIQGDSNRWSLISDKGVYKLRDQIISYPLTSGNTLGYDALNSKDESAILDFYNMVWIIAPQSKIKLRSINYSSSEKLNPEDPQDRGKATIYYSIWTDNAIIYKDLKGNIYLPRK